MAIRRYRDDPREMDATERVGLLAALALVVGNTIPVVIYVLSGSLVARRGKEPLV